MSIVTFGFEGFLFVSNVDLLLRMFIFRPCLLLRSEQLILNASYNVSYLSVNDSIESLDHSHLEL